MKTITKLGLYLFSVIALIACQKQLAETQPHLTKYTDQPNFCQTVSEKAINACSAQGGTLQKQGKAQCYTCTIDYSDAGKTCSASSDCQGDCYNYGNPVPVNTPNQTGTCAKNNVIFGCHQKIEHGVAPNAMLCVD